MVATLHLITKDSNISMATSAKRMLTITTHHFYGEMRYSDFIKYFQRFLYITPHNVGLCNVYTNFF